MQICCHGNMLALSRGFGAKLLTPAVSQAERHTHTLARSLSLSLSPSLSLSLSLSPSPPILSLTHTHAHARTDAPAHIGAHHVMRALELWWRGGRQIFFGFSPPGGFVCITFTVFVFFVLFLAPSPSPLCGSSNNCTF